MGKAMVIDQVPKRIKHLKFGCMDPSDLVRQGVLEVSTRDLYTFGGSDRKPAQNGALDRRMVCAFPRPRGRSTCLTHVGDFK